VFRSRQRPVVYPQAEHARLSGVIAASWGNDEVPRPPLPFESFVRGVALHDRGYGMLDDDPLGEMARERWLEIARRSFEAQDDDPVVDLVVAMHVRRLMSHGPFSTDAAIGAELDAALARRIEAAGVDAADATAADAVTDLCDRLAFAFCFEEADSGTVEPPGISYSVHEDGSATLSPWPLAVASLSETVTGYRSEGYPELLESVERVFRLGP
jgi:uncharacterized protein DUF3891